MKIVSFTSNYNSSATLKGDGRAYREIENETELAKEFKARTPKERLTLVASRIDNFGEEITMKLFRGTKQLTSGDFYYDNFKSISIDRLVEMYEKLKIKYKAEKQIAKLNAKHAEKIRALTRLTKLM